MTRRLTLRTVMHADLTKGGTLWAHEILDGEKVIGTRTILRETRRSPDKVTFALLSANGEPATEFATAAEFQAAYEATL